MALSILLDGVEVVGYLRERSITVTRTNGGRAGRAVFTLTGWGVPATNGTCVIADPGLGGTLFDGNVRSYRSSETTRGQVFVDVTALDAGATPAGRAAPFSLVDRDPEAIYTAMMATLTAPYEWWRLGEASGGTAWGEMGNQSGTYGGSPTLGVTGAMDGIADTAIDLDGTDFVAVGSNHLRGRPSFSIAAWFKTSSTAAAQMIYAESANTPSNPLIRLFIATGTGRPTFQYRDDAGVLDALAPSSGNWADGAWHHVMLIKDYMDAILFVDGVQVAADPALDASDTLTGTLYDYIGCDGDGSYKFVGSIDEVMVWQDVVDTTYAARLHAAGHQRRYAEFIMEAVSDGTGQTLDVVVTTYEAGVQAGDVIGLSSINVGVGMELFTVQEVATSWKNATTPVYALTCGDVPLTMAGAFP